MIVQVRTAHHSLIHKVLLTYAYPDSCTTSAQGEDQYRALKAMEVTRIHSEMGHHCNVLSRGWT